jgi:signal transduction histidine kinase
MSDQPSGPGYQPGSSTTEPVATAIGRAQIELSLALAELDRVATLESGSVAFAAHTLNNYLNVTTATLELVTITLDGHADQQLHMWLDSLRHATSLMSRTVSQLMNASVGQDLTLRKEALRPSSMAERAAQFYQRLAHEKGIQVIFTGVFNAPVIHSDRVAVAAIVDNLLSNAVKFSPAGGVVDVSVAELDHEVVIRVRDQGPGLSEADQRRLFQRGVRLTPQPTGDEPSTGYGLAVAKELSDRLGGELSCESVLGQGSTFSIRLPIAGWPEPPA